MVSMEFEHLDEVFCIRCGKYSRTIEFYTDSMKEGYLVMKCGNFSCNIEFTIKEDDYDKCFK